ncbi:MAG: DNA gyrase inhibitor YacG [Beijerinckiaceae bacterium]
MTEKSSSNVQIAHPRPCPICAKPETFNYRPFCSKRCADVDLHRWLSGTYAIPVKDDEDEDGAPVKDERTP